MKNIVIVLFLFAWMSNISYGQVQEKKLEKKTLIKVLEIDRQLEEIHATLQSGNVNTKQKRAALKLKSQKLELEKRKLKGEKIPEVFSGGNDGKQSSSPMQYDLIPLKEEQQKGDRKKH